MRPEEIAARLAPLPDSILVGLSGGADSVALLRILCCLPGKRIAAVHVNHGLRGEASDGDEAFCRILCESLGVDLTVERLSLAPGTGEGPARDARYAAFRRAMDMTGCEALALAHHRGDQAETVLTHLLRGAGLRGLCGMEAETELFGMRIVRPLLGRTRGELRECLRGIGQDWREDATNEETGFLRNRVRLEVLPAMRGVSPEAERHIAQTAELLREDLRTLEALTADFLDRNAGEDWLWLAPLRRLPTGLQRRALRTWWARKAQDGPDERSLSAEQTEELMRTTLGPEGGCCNLPGGLRAFRERHCLHLTAGTEASAPPDSPLDRSVGTVISGCRLVRTAYGEGDRVSLTVPAALLPSLTVRTPRRGDTILPPRSGHTRPLEDYFRQREVDRSFRARIPLICMGQTVLHAAGLGRGEGGTATDHPDTTDTVTFTWEGSMPWTLKEEQHGS
ncbi:MAG: tRNA lysidine(34) synthetase TilS [Clostridia bacterium]|nr:tRNA lysidine(34) synthetase TilS [Clostridia bacterium]